MSRHLMEERRILKKVPRDTSRWENDVGQYLKMELMQANWPHLYKAEEELFI